MNNIVIVEDKIKRAISLADQFVELSKASPELQLEVTDICYFCPKEEIAEIEVQSQAECGFNIRRVTLENFRQIMDEYLDSKRNRTFLIMDFMLDGDGSDGTPMRRVNIRYARNRNRYTTNRLWFYTATGTANEEALGKLVGKEHVLDVTEVNDNILKLRLNTFVKALQDFQEAEG